MLNINQSYFLVYLLYIIIFDCCCLDYAVAWDDEGITREVASWIAGKQDGGYGDSRREEMDDGV